MERGNSLKDTVKCIQCIQGDREAAKGRSLKGTYILVTHRKQHGGERKRKRIEPGEGKGEKRGYRRQSEMNTM